MRFRDRCDRLDCDALRRMPRRVRERHDSAAKAVFGGLAQAILAVGHRADLPGEAEFAENREVQRQRLAAQARQSAATTARSAAVSVSRTPPTTLTKTSCACTAMPA